MRSALRHKPRMSSTNARPHVPVVNVSARAAARLRAGHPWVYRTDIVRMDDAAPGDAVQVRDGKTVLGSGFYSSTSMLAVRVCGRDAERLDGAWLRRRLVDALDLRTRAFPSLPPAYRWVHGEADFLPGLVVDRMGDQLAVQLNTQGIDRLQGTLVPILVELARPRSIVLRKDVAVRAKEGLPLLKEVAHGTVVPARFKEGDAWMTVDLLEGQKTGTFLDQRDNHVLAGTLARGRGLDCFSGDGGFALQMARRCAHVTAIDQSATAVERIAANARDNGMENVEARAADAFDALRALESARERFDTVVVDPPAFAKGRKTLDAALRGYKELNLRALKLLNPGGMLVSCSCSQPVDAGAFDGMLRSAAADARRSVHVVHRRGAGPDHPVRPGFPESEYLKCVIAVVGE